MIIGVGTASALKLRAVRTALDFIAGQIPDEYANYELRSGETSSGVPSQPFGEAEIFSGAERRARGALKNADIGIGIENGLVDILGRWYDPPAVVVISKRWNVIGRSLGMALPIPTSMVDEVRARKTELGVVVQERAGGGEKDPHKFLSQGLVDREAILVQAILGAFCVVTNPHAYITVNPNE